VERLPKYNDQKAGMVVTTPEISPWWRAVAAVEFLHSYVPCMAAAEFLHGGIPPAALTNTIHNRQLKKIYGGQCHSFLAQGKKCMDSSHLPPKNPARQ
jgi:hypothetical protein